MIIIFRQNLSVSLIIPYIHYRKLTKQKRSQNALSIEHTASINTEVEKVYKTCYRKFKLKKLDLNKPQRSTDRKQYIF